MIVTGVKCLRYHSGVDGLGTCDDGCQWWVEGIPCPYWFTESTYQRIKGIWKQVAPKSVVEANLAGEVS